MNCLYCKEEIYRLNVAPFTWRHTVSDRAHCGCLATPEATHAARKKEERSFSVFSPDEADEAIAGSGEFIVLWLDAYGIRYGSGGDYNVYRAVQEALRLEWLKGREHRKRSG